MIKNILINVALVVLLAVNVVSIIKNGVSMLNMAAIILCVIIFALGFVNRKHSGE